MPGLVPDERGTHEDANEECVSSVVGPKLNGRSYFFNTNILDLSYVYKIDNVQIRERDYLLFDKVL